MTRGITQERTAVWDHVPLMALDFRGATARHDDDIHGNTLIVLRGVTVVREPRDKSLRMWPLGQLEAV
eukprot:271649-Rhodomonas_salina.3